MKLAYFDCFSGAAGDMILAALVDAGLGADALREEIAKLGLDGFNLRIEKIKKQGFAATKVHVEMTATPGHRHLRHIVEILDRSRLLESVRSSAKAVFTRLAEAEAKVHNSTIEKVHFHEVGAIDAIVDIVGAVAALQRLGVERVICSPIPTGSGTVTCDHGVMPVPAPGTAELLRGVPIQATDEVGELTTPTGAAVLTTLASGYGPLPAMTIQAVGYGAGHRDGKTRPNLLRVILGAVATSAAQTDEVIVLEANLDDMTGETLGYVCDRLMADGALDVSTTPITMKKGRPAVRLSVLASPDVADRLEEVIFIETTTFGVRRYGCRRSTLERATTPVETKYGPIRIKVGRRGGKAVIASAEYEDCAAAARRCGAALRDVMAEAMFAWRTSGGAGG